MNLSACRLDRALSNSLLGHFAGLAYVVGTKCRMTTDAEIDGVVRQQIAAKKDRLSPNTGTPIEIEEIDIVAAMLHRGDRFHKPITVHYHQGSQAGVTELWLKFRPGLDAVYPLLEAYDRRLSDSFFPKPFFSWHSSEDDSAFIVTERVTGRRFATNCSRTPFSIGRTG